jgi:predicted MFS family arabinose efflux permease
VLAAPLIAGRGSGMRRSQLTTVATAVYGSALVVFALSPWYAMAVGALMVAGAAYLAIASTLNTTIQLQVEETMRGKVLAAYLMCLTLAMPLGVLAQGALAEAIGARATVAGAGMVFLVAVAWLRWGTSYIASMDDQHDAVAQLQSSSVPVTQARPSVQSA